MARCFRRTRVVLALAVGVMVAVGAIQVSPAGADKLTSTYTTPGTYTPTVPLYTSSLNVVVNGASGKRGSAAGFPGGGGGSGGDGTLLSVGYPVASGAAIAPGDTLQVVVGAQGAGGAGGS